MPLDPAHAGFAPAPFPDHADIYRLEAQLLSLPQVDMPVEHDFCSGMYARTMHIPAQTALTGAVHKHDCFFVVRAGQIAVSTDGAPRILAAGDMLVTKAGSKRAGVALTDVIVTTFHLNPTDEQDPTALWDLFTVQPPLRFLTDEDIARLENQP